MRSVWYDRTYQLAWWLCVVTLPWTIRLNSLSIAGLALVWALEGNWEIKWQRLKSASWAVPFLAFFVVHLLGLLLTQNISSGLFELEKKITFVLLPLIAATGKPLDQVFFGRLKTGFIYSCALLAITSIAYTLFHYLSSSHEVSNFGRHTDELFHLFNPEASTIWEYFSYVQLGSWIDLHPGYFALHILFCVLILLDNMTASKRTNPATAGLIIFFTIVLILLASRMSIICFALVLVYFIGREWYRRSRQAYPIGVFLIVLFGLVWANPVSRFRVIQEPRVTALEFDKDVTEWNSINLRLLEWQASWSTIRTSWFTGVGTGDGQDVLKAYYASFNPSTMKMDFNAHNQYFQTTIELGFAGLVALLFCFFFPSFQPGRSVLYLAFVAVFSILCLTECLLARQKGIVFFTLFQSLFLSIRSFPSR